MTPQEVVQRFAAELNANKYSNSVAKVGTSVVDDAVRAASKFADTDEVLTQMKADQVTAEKLAVEEVLGSSYEGKTLSDVSTTVLNGNAMDDQKALSRGTPVTVRDVIRERKAYIFLEKFCGIQLNENFYLQSNVIPQTASASDNTDTGAITGSDANLTLKVGDTVNGTELTANALSDLKVRYGNKATLTGDTLLIGTGSTKTAENIMPGSGMLSTDETIDSFEVSGLTVNVENYSSLTDAQKEVVAKLKQWWTKGAVDLNEAGYSLGFEDAKITDINLTFSSTASKLATATPTYRTDGTITGLTLTINTTKSGELNRAVANEISRAVVAANVTNFNNLPSFIKEGMSELTHGVDDERGREIFTLAVNDNSLTSALNLTTVTDSPTNNYTYAGGYIFMRYFANQAAVQTVDDSIVQGDINATVDLSLGNGTYYVTGNNISESAVKTKPSSNEATSLGSATYNSYTIATTPIKQTIEMGNTARKITDINSNTTVIGGTGNDTLEIVEGTYVDAGNGNNSLKVSAQFATIDAGTGNDSVTVDGGGFNSINLGDGYNRVTLTTSDYDNSITAGAGNDTIVDANNRLHYNYLVDTGAGNDRVSLNARDSTIKTGAGNDTVGFINSSGTGNFVDLGSGNDTVTNAGKNNTITGAGNNFVSASGGGNVYAFTGVGNNTLRGFNSSDKVSLSGNYYTSVVSGGYVINTDNGSISVAGSFNPANNIIGGSSVAPDTTAGDTINNSDLNRIATNNTLVSGTAHSDSISNGGRYVTIDAGAGQDTIENRSSHVTIDAGDGNDSITNYYAVEESINAGAGNDYIGIYGTSYSTIDAGAGNDTIENHFGGSNFNRINGGDGHDFIAMHRNGVLSNGNFNTINGGKGNDTINLYPENTNSTDVIEYASGDGDDVINATYGTNYQIKLTSGTLTNSVTSGSDVILTIGTGSITLQNAAYYHNLSVNGNVINVNSKSTTQDPTVVSATEAIKSQSFYRSRMSINGSPYDDHIIARNDETTVNAGNGNDRIQSMGHRSQINGDAGNDYFFVNGEQQNTINGGAGDDTIRHEFGREALINGGDGNDTIEAYASNFSTVLGGAGDDSILNSNSQNVTLDGGAGNDKITLGGGYYNRTKNTLIQYTAGQGDDTVWGFNSTDTLQISGSAYTSTRTGNGILFTMNNGNGSVLLVDAAKYLPLNVTDGTTPTGNQDVTLGNGNETYTTNKSDISVVGGTGDDKIKVIGENVSVKPGAGDDTVVSEQPITLGHGTGDGNDTVVASADVNVDLTGGTLGNTAQSGNDIVLGVGNESITVNLPDDAQLTVKDSTGTKTVKAAVTDVETTEPDTTPTDDPNIIALTEFVDTYINTTEGVSIRALEGNDTLTNVAANVSVDGMDGDDKILNSFVPNVTLNGGKGDDFLANYGENGSISGGLGNDEIYNYNANNTIQGGKGDDKISLHSAADKTILQYDASNSEGNDTVWGFTAEDSLVIDNTETYSSLRQGNDLLINVDNGSVLLIDFFGDGRGNGSSSGSGSGAGTGTGGNLANISIPASATDTTPAPLMPTDGLTPQDDVYTNRRDNVTLDALTGDDNLINYGKNISLDAAGGKDSVYNYGEGSTILGNAGDDYIDNTANNVTVDAGADNDSVYNSGSNVTISGGTGNDSVTLSPDAKNVVLEYFSGDGDDTVWGFTNEDSLVAYGNSFNTLRSGDDIYVSVDGGTVLLIGAANLEQFNLGNETPTVTHAETTVNTVPAAKETVGGSDSINNTGEGAQIDLTGDGNGVDNSAPNTTINTGDGDATVDNKKDATGTQINTGTGNTVVDNAAPNTTVDAGGNDTISNTGDEVSIATGATEPIDVPEVINNWGDSVTVDAAPTLETGDYVAPIPFDVTNHGDKPSITTGDKADTVTNDGGNPTISTGDGGDIVDNSGNGDSVNGGSINTGKGDDTVKNRGKSITITGGLGNDSVDNEGDQTSIDGGKGNDTIKNRGNSITITGGQGDDLIDNEGDNVVIDYKPGDGNDTVTGFNETSTLSIGGGEVETIKDGDDIIVNVTDGDNEGSVTLVDAASLPTVNIAVDTTPADTTPAEVTLDDGGDDYTNKLKAMTVTGGKGDDTITNIADSVSVDGGAGNDTITNDGGDDSTLEGGAGYDTIYSAGSDGTSVNGGDGDDAIYIVPTVDRAGTVPSSNNTVEGGAGDDYIYDTGAKNSSLDGGEGDDKIIDAGKNNTLAGGEGDDKITLKPASENAVIDYKPGDGDDTVYGFNPTTTLHIADDAPFSTDTVDNNIVVSVGSGEDAGTITLVDAASLPAPVITGTNPVNPLYQELTPYNDNYTNKVDDATLDAMTGNDTLNIYGNRVSLDAAGGNDLVTSYGNDVTIRGGKESNAGNGDLANFDGDAMGNDTITSNGDNAVLDGGDGDDQFISNGDNAFIVGGLGNDSITLAPDAKNNIIEFVTGDGDDTVWGFTPEDSLVAYGYSLETTRSGDNGQDILLTTDNGTVLLKDVGGLPKVNIAGAKPDETPSLLPDTTPADSQENSVDGAQVELKDNDSAKNTGNRVTITGSDGNNDIDNTGDEVSISAGDGTDTVNTTGDSVNADGGAGADDMNNKGGKSVTLTGGTGDDTIFSTPDESIAADNPSIDGGEGNDLIVAEGDKPTVTGGDGDDTITGTGDDGSIDGGAGKDNITGIGNRITITGGEGSDNIDTTGDDDSVDAGKGDDTVKAKGNRITITGGTGEDSIDVTDATDAVIEYNAGDGDDTIKGFAPTDTLSIKGGEVSQETVDNDVVIKVDEDTITLVDAVELPTINVVHEADDDGGAKSKIISLTPQDDVYANSESDVTLLALTGDDKLDNDAPNVSINSEAGDNYINNRSNGSNVTIETGDGKDSIYNWADVTNVSVNAGDGDNYIYNEAADSDLKTGNGADKIINYKTASGTAIDAGDGADKINNSAANVTITAGGGNDSINLTPDATNNIIEYVTGDGDDTVWGFTPEDSLVAYVNDTFQSVKSGNDILVTIDNGTITLKDVGDLKLGEVHVVTLEPGETYEPTPAASLTNSVNNENQTLGDNDSITNTGNDLSITGGTGDNGIDNTGRRVTITGSDGNDTINTGDSINPNTTNDSVIADGGKGDDQITNKGRRVTITGSDGNDTIDNAGDSVVADGGAGDDSVINKGKRVTITGSDGNDTINNFGDSVEAAGGKGSDQITNAGAQVTMTGDGGNDTLTNTADSVAADGGAGDDQIKNAGKYVTLTGGDGSDTVSNTGDSVTVNGNAGDDSIDNTGENVMFEYTNGDGDDTINGFNATSTLSVAGGAINTLEVDGDLVVNTDDGSITLTDAATLEAPIIVNDTTPANSKVITLTANNDNYTNSAADVTILALEGNDTINNAGDNVSISGDAGNDNITNTGKGVTIDGGEGKDTLRNDGGVANVLSGGDGDDSIYNSGNRSTVFGGDGSDSIELAGYNLTADGGDGDDSILNNGSQTTITGGKGNDSIRLADSSAENLIAYNAGDGSDTVYGFKATDTLSITGGAATSTKSGNDLIFTVGNDSILLVDAASLEPLNVISKYIELTPQEDTYTNTLAGATIDALESDDNLTNNAEDVSINANAGNDTVTNTASNVTIVGAAGNDSISLSPDAENVILEYVTGDGDDTVWNFGSDDSLIAYGFEFSSTKSGNDVLVTIDDGTILIKNTASIASNLNIQPTDPPPDVEPVKKNITLTEGDDTYNNTLRGATINALGGDDTLTNTADSVSIDGGRGTDDITTDGDFVTINGGITSDNISLSADSDSVLIQYSTGDGDDTVWGFNETSTLSIAGSKVDSVTTGDDILVTLEGGSVLLKDSASLSPVNITVEEPSVNLFIVLTPWDDDYTNTLTRATVLAFGGNDTLINNAEESYIDAGIGNDLITAASNYSTIFAGEGNDSINVTGSNNILNLSNGDDSVYVTGNNNVLNLGGGADTVKIDASVTELKIKDFGYSDVLELPEAVDSLVIVDGSLVAGNTTIEGIAAEGMEVEDYYWKVERGTAYYMKRDAVGGAKLDDDGKTVRFISNYGSDQIIFNLNGLNPDLTADDIAQLVSIDDDKIITIPDEALAKKNISLWTNSGYSLALKNEHPITDVEAGWHFFDQSNVASLTSAGKSDGYEVGNSRTIYYTPYQVTVYTTITGLDDAVTEADLDKYVTYDTKTRYLSVSPEVVIGDNFTPAWSPKVSLEAGTYSGIYHGTNNSESIEVLGSGVTIDVAGGYDTIISGENPNTYLLSSLSSHNTFVNFSNNETIKVTDDSTYNTRKYKNDLIVSGDRSSFTLKDPYDGMHVFLVDKDNNIVMDRYFYKDYTLEGDMLLLEYTYELNYFNANATNPNVSAANMSKRMTLIGGAEDNKFVGSGTTDWFAPGTGNNLLTTNHGFDTVAFGGGNDTVTDYEQNYDVIYLGAPYSAYQVDDNGNLTFKVGSGSVTLLDAVDKKILIHDGKNLFYESFTSDGVYNYNKSSLTLAPTVKAFNNAASSLYTIDGSQASSVSIAGNNKANVIIGSSGNDTLAGDYGNDTLTGGDGTDTFVLDHGNNFVTDFQSGVDKIFSADLITNQTVQRNGNIVVANASGHTMTVVNKDQTFPFQVTFTDGKNDTVSTFYSEKIVANGATTLLSNFTGSFAASTGFPVVNASLNGNAISLSGGAENNTIIGGFGNNTINAGSGRNLISGGAGYDTFVFANGLDTISDYAPGADRISISSARNNVKISGDDVIIGFANNSSINIQNAVDKQITFVENFSAGYSQTYVNVFNSAGIFDAGYSAVTLDAATRNFDADSYSKLVTIDGSAVTGSSSILGNAKANQIYASNAGSTLNGGKGNDSLWGGTGKDNFIYSDGDGKDVIYGFDNRDQIKIDGEFTAAVSGNNLVFNVGSTNNAITLKDYTATTFNVNGSNYQISNGEFTKK